ncbi:hypothetical protein [Kordia jejudonensis]|uniref:hypothetical protein n=1 Tax=Kordia jejudonensis TaxID=1348245 RepID=UPI000629394F|nr:hypothetical protein [Kordia jejudonensis]
MKKSIKNIVSILLMIVSMASYANSDYSLHTKKGSTVLTLPNVKKGHQLLIKDTNFLVLYREAITQNGDYSKGFDLTNLPDGSYYFELEKDVKIVTIPFSVTDNTVKFDKEKETILYKPTVRLLGNKLCVSRLSLEAQPMKIELFYTGSLANNKALLFSEEIENTKIISRIYELSKEKKGKYTVIFTTQGRAFTEKINF